MPPSATTRRCASTLLRRLEATHAAHAAVRALLPPPPAAADVLSTYELTHQAVQQFIVTTHTEWFGTVEPSLGRALAAPLLAQDRAERERPAQCVCPPCWLGAIDGMAAGACMCPGAKACSALLTAVARPSSPARLGAPPNLPPNARAPPPGGLLSVNFAPALLSMSAEVVQWERLRMPVPYVAMEIQAQRDKYRALRGHALALVGGAGSARMGNGFHMRSCRHQVLVMAALLLSCFQQLAPCCTNLPRPRSITHVPSGARLQPRAVQPGRTRARAVP